MQEPRLGLLFGRGRKNSSMERVWCVLIGYVFGLFQTGYIYGKINHIDIRQYGSGNAGTTNAIRVMGVKAGAITLFGDCAKALAACVLARVLFKGGDIPAGLLALYAGFGVVLGHNYPFYLKFRGGKGIAATFGILLAFDYRVAIVLIAVFAVTLLISRYVSVSSLLMMFCFFVIMVWLGVKGSIFESGTIYVYEADILAFLLAVIATVRHRQNIVRLQNGNENKFTLKKKKAVE